MTEAKDGGGFRIGVRLIELTFDPFGRPIAFEAQRHQSDVEAVGKLRPNLVRQIFDDGVEHRRWPVEHRGHFHLRLLGLRACERGGDEQGNEGQAKQPHRGRSIVDDSPIP